MKITKEIRQFSRDMVRASFADGMPDQEKIRAFVRSIGEKKPRNYIAILQNFHRLLRLELEKRRVLIESAMALDPEVGREIVSSLEKKYGSGLTTEQVVNPALLGGVRVRVGSDVWDSSVRSRLERLQQQL
jgi:F-type H+-transporting ATPase subunit delta